MPLPRRWLLYLLLVHLGLGGLVFWHLREEPWWFLGLEVALAVSFLVGFSLSRRSGLPRELLKTGSELMREEEFGSRLSPGDDPDAEQLVRLFNTMMERLRQERLLVQEREHLLDEVVRASPAAFLTLDHDGRIDLANPAAERMLESSGPALAGRDLVDVPHPVAGELAGLRDGETRLLNLQGSRLRATRSSFYDQGFPRAFYLVEELTEELRATERAAYGRLIRLISHEVKNSVGAVISLLQTSGTMATELPGPRREKTIRALGVAEDRLRNLDRFVNGFADVVRLPRPELRPVDPGTLLDDLLALMEPTFEERRIHARWSRRDPVTPLPGDKNQLEQALLNVLKNAAEAIGEDGEIAVSLVSRPDGTELSIADSGPGISESMRQQLFVPFVSTKRDGRGLGLTLIREILEGHGWGYSLENRAEGGAVFRVAIPTARSASPSTW